MRFERDQRSGLLLPNRKLQRGFFAMGPAFFKHASGGGGVATRVDVQQYASGPSNGFIGANRVLPSLSGIQAGDLIVVCAQSLGHINPSGVPTDSSSNSYSTDYNNTLTTRDDERVYHAIAGSNASSLAVTFHNASTFYGQITAAAYRAPSGATWSFDSANFSAHTNGYNTSAISKTFDMSGPGVAAVMFNSGNADGGPTDGLVGTCTNADIQKECTANSTVGYGYFSYYADYLTAAALSSYTVSGNVYTSTPGDTYSNKDILIVPFTYS